MKSSVAALAVLLMFMAGEASAQPQVIMGLGLNSGRQQYRQNFNRTLSKDTLYILTSMYIIDSTYSLTINPGTIIKGDTASTLVVQRGGKLFANGTAAEPVVFTSLKAPGSRAPGDWAGVVILGAAPTNQANPQIEGGIVPGDFGGGGIGLGNPNDNSGSLTYVRIEYGGYRFQLNNEINGLTLGGVGAGTTIHHVQVSYSNDDAYEFFGGTVSPHHLVALGERDDNFDTDWGFQGHLQFLLDMKDPAITEFSGGQTNGFESDNEGSPSYVNPRTRPIFSNVTVIGPRRNNSIVLGTPGTDANRFEYAAVIRRGSQLSCYNSIFMGFPLGGPSFRDVQTNGSACGDTMRWRNISLQAEGTPIHVTGGTPCVIADWFNTPAYNNLGGTAVSLPDAMGLANMGSLQNPDPRPTAATPGVNTVDFSDPDLAGFTAVNYRGAFDPALPMDQQWTAGWTNFDPQHTIYNAVTLTAGVPWSMLSVPFDPPVSPTAVDPSIVFPGVTLPVWRFNTATQGYAQATGLVPGEGYWVKYTGPTTLTLSGTPLTTVSATVTGTPWVLLGTISTDVSTSNITTNPPGSLAASPIYRFNRATQGYTATTTIPAGEAVWVKVTQNCTITITQ